MDMAQVPDASSVHKASTDAAPGSLQDRPMTAMSFFTVKRVRRSFAASADEEKKTHAKPDLSL